MTLEWLIPFLCLIFATGGLGVGLIIYGRDRSGSLVARATERLNRAVAVAKPELEPKLVPPELELEPSDMPQWVTYAQHAKELGVTVPKPGDELRGRRDKAIAEFDRVYADGSYTDDGLKRLKALTEYIEYLQEQINLAAVMPKAMMRPDLSWVTMESIGPAWPKKRVPDPPRRCLVCGYELGPWTGPGSKPDWRIAGFCTKACADAMDKATVTVAQLDAIERRIEANNRRIKANARRIDAASHRFGVWLEAGETIQPARPFRLAPNEYVRPAKLHACARCARYAGADGLCQQCYRLEKEKG